MTAVQVKTNTVGGTSVIHLTGTLDGSSAPIAQAAIGPQIGLSIASMVMVKLLIAKVLQHVEQQTIQ